jgi:hypothetical protein
MQERLMTGNAVDYSNNVHDIYKIRYRYVRLIANSANKKFAAV